jgi:predicted site-specific integrase-resolvase
MVEEITIEGTRFVAAKQAASLVGMSPDYLTRWCREGLVKARRLAGGIWFVNLQSLQQHLADRSSRKAQRYAQLSQRLREERAHATS